jgi:Cap4 SAVED domain
MSIYREKPTPFAEMHIQELDPFPTITGLCIGYERGEWRDLQFGDYLFHYLAEFALTHSELEQLTHVTAHQVLRSAAKAVYETDRFDRRGEFGELMLHALVRQLFDSEPAVSKLYYKDSANNTVKGFDAVHVVASPTGQLELWLGEAKFYDDGRRAIRDVVTELKQHFEDGFLRSEFAVVTRFLDPTWEHSEALLDLLDEHRSLDQIVDRIRVPVLITYDSDLVGAYTECSAAYIEAFEKEIRDLHEYFSEKDFPPEILVHLLLVPLKSKREFVAALDAKLKAWQAI